MTTVKLIVMTNYEMRLERIELKNYRQFGIFETDFDKRLTVLCGDNGAGKTAVLVGRIAHLIREQQIKPAEIVVLAFNRAVKSIERKFAKSEAA